MLNVFDHFYFDLMPLLYLHPQSLQIAAFLFTVCHVVVVVQDWFTDLNLYRYCFHLPVGEGHVYSG